MYDDNDFPDSESEPKSDPLPPPALSFPIFTAEDSNDQLADKITKLAGQINAANYRFIKMIAEFNRRVAWEGPGIRSCAYWLNWKCGIDMGAAREKVRVGLALDGLPKINLAFEKGELSYSKVRAMTRVATAENESYLLNIAHHGTAQHVEKLVGAYRIVSRREDFPGAYEASVLGERDESVVTSERKIDKRRDQALYESRAVSFFQDDEGMWTIKAKLPAEEGGLLVKLLQELGDRMVTPKLDVQKSNEPNVVDSTGDSTGDASLKSTVNVSAETFSDYKKDAVPKKSLLEERVEEIVEEIVKEKRLTFTQRRADALVAIAENFLATAGDGNDGALFSTLKGHERCQLLLHVHHGLAEAGPQDNLDGRWLMPDAARRLACDGGLLVVEQDEAGNVLDIGRRTRIIPPAMSRALAERDGRGCQFPGCCASRYVEGHHIKHWADGGETKLDNLVTLCSYHHRELHKGNFSLEVKPTPNNKKYKKYKKPVRFAERLCFTTVDRYSNKTRIIVANPVNFSGADTCDDCGFDDCGFDDFKQSLPKTVYNGIDATTAVTKWLGERMDIGMAIDGLLRADGQPIDF
jgi:hypothetical protein